MVVEGNGLKIDPSLQAAVQVCEREYSNLVIGAPLGHFWSVPTSTGSPPDGAVHVQPLPPQGGVQFGPIQGGVGVLQVLAEMQIGGTGLGVGG